MENSTCTFTKAFVLYYITMCRVISRFFRKIFTKTLIAFKRWPQIRPDKLFHDGGRYQLETSPLICRTKET